MRKKAVIISTIITLLLVILTIVVEVRRNIDYKTIVNTSINEYLSTNNIKELDDIKSLLDSFKYDKGMIKTINNYIYKEVGERMILIDDLYTCTLENKIDCQTQINEFNRFNEQITIIHNEKTSKKITIMEDNDYNNINEEINKKVVGLESIINAN